jgi:Tfp pilus assembly PilM family ATPase
MIKGMSQYSVIGVDFRDASVAMLQYARSAPRWTPHAAGVRLFGPQADAAGYRRALVESLSSLRAYRPFCGNAVVATLPGTRVETRLIRLPAGITPESGDAFQRALVKEAKAVLLYDLRDAVLDYLPVGLERFDNEERFVLVLIASPREHVEFFLGVLREVDLECRELAFAPCAFAARYPLSTTTYGLIELNLNHTSISIAREGLVLFNRRVPHGLHAALQEIGRVMTVDTAEAWSMLRHYGIQHRETPSYLIGDVLETGILGQGRIASMLYKATSETLGSVVHEIDRSISYFTNHRHGTAVDRVFLTGEGVVRGMKELLSDRIELPVLLGSRELGQEPVAAHAYPNDPYMIASALAYRSKAA